MRIALRVQVSGVWVHRGEVDEYGVYIRAYSSDPGTKIGCISGNRASVSESYTDNLEVGKFENGKVYTYHYGRHEWQELGAVLRDGLYAYDFRDHSYSRKLVEAENSDTYPSLVGLGCAVLYWKEKIPSRLPQK